jgi:hypothetical protein
MNRRQAQAQAMPPVNETLLPLAALAALAFVAVWWESERTAGGRMKGGLGTALTAAIGLMLLYLGATGRWSIVQQFWTTLTKGTAAGSGSTSSGTSTLLSPSGYPMGSPPTNAVTQYNLAQFARLGATIGSAYGPAFRRR